MKCLRCCLPAGTLLLLSVAGVIMAHLQAENLNLLPQDKHNLVLNLGTRGICAWVDFHFQFNLCLCFLSEKIVYLLGKEMRLTCKEPSETRRYGVNFMQNIPVIAFKY